MVAVRTRVLLECPLREAVESEGGDGAFEMRGGDTPGAVGAAPAGEVVAFDPDQTFMHTALPFYLFTFFCLRWDSSSGAAGGTQHRARKVNSCPPQTIFHGFAIGQSN